MIVLAGYAVYRGLNAAGPRAMARRPGLAILGAAGIIAPFLSGLEQQPMRLNMVPAFALRQWQDRTVRRRLEEQQSAQETFDVIEDPPGGGAPGSPLFYLWYTVDLVVTVRETLNRALVRQIMGRSNNNWLMRFGSEKEVLARLAEIKSGNFAKWYLGKQRELINEFGKDPFQEDDVPGSERFKEGGGEEEVDESTPVGNSW